MGADILTSLPPTATPALLCLFVFEGFRGNESGRLLCLACLMLRNDCYYGRGGVRLEIIHHSTTQSALLISAWISYPSKDGVGPQVRIFFAHKIINH